MNVDAATEYGVIVANAPGRNAPAAAEYTLGLMLAAMKRIPEAHASLQEGRWRGDFYAYEENGVELDGATVGLVGFGAVGGRVAKVLRAFGATVLVHDPFVEDERVEAVGASKAALDDLLRRSGVVSLHARLTYRTRGMIGAEQIARMPEGSRLFEAPNLVLSPHIAGATRETAHRAASIAAAEVGRYARGEDLANPVNPEVVFEDSSK